MTDTISLNAKVAAIEEQLHDNALSLIAQINQSGLPYSQEYAEYIELEMFFFDNYNLKGYLEFVEDLKVMSPRAVQYPITF